MFSENLSGGSINNMKIKQLGFLEIRIKQIIPTDRLTNVHSTVFFIIHLDAFSVADPGFPVRGVLSHCVGGANLQHRHFLVKMYVKMKELDPVGGGAHWQRSPGSTNDFANSTQQ